MTVSVVLESAGRRRSPATMPGYRRRPAAAGQGDALRAKRPWSCAPPLCGKAVAARDLAPCSAEAGMATLVRATFGGGRLVDAGGEQAEIVGQGAVGEFGDACAQDGDRLGR
jgi:hypothetical protein